MKIAFIFCFIMIVLSKKLALNIDVDRPICFYEMLTINQKYSFIVTGLSQHRFEASIKHFNNGQWQILSRKEHSQYGNINIHKLAITGDVHEFCVANLGTETMRVKIQIICGLQLANFQYLPDKNDQENMNRQVQFLQIQRDNILRTLDRLQNVRTNSEALQNTLSTTMIMFGLFGLIIILTANYALYLLTKKTFKDRKLI